MSVPLEALIAANKVDFVFPPEEVMNEGPDFIDLFNTVMAQSGSDVRFKPLADGVLSFQTADNPFHVPDTLTNEQIQAIIYSTPNYSAMEIGQFEYPVQIPEIFDRKIVEVQTVIIGTNRSTTGDSLTWDVFAVAPDGEITMVKLLQ